RRFPRARRTADHDRFPLFHGEVDVVEDVKRAEPFVHALKADHSRLQNGGQSVDRLRLRPTADVSIPLRWKNQGKLSRAPPKTGGNTPIHGARPFRSAGGQPGLKPGLHETSSVPSGSGSVMVSAKCLPDPLPSGKLYLAGPAGRSG